MLDFTLSPSAGTRTSNASSGDNEVHEQRIDATKIIRKQGDRTRRLSAIRVTQHNAGEKGSRRFSAVDAADFLSTSSAPSTPRPPPKQKLQGEDLAELENSSRATPARPSALHLAGLEKSLPALRCQEPTKLDRERIKPVTELTKQHERQLGALVKLRAKPAVVLASSSSSAASTLVSAPQRAPKMEQNRFPEPQPAFWDQKETEDLAVFGLKVPMRDVKVPPYPSLSSNRSNKPHDSFMSSTPRSIADVVEQRLDVPHNELFPDTSPTTYEQYRLKAKDLENAPFKCATFVPTAQKELNELAEKLKRSLEKRTPPRSRHTVRGPRLERLHEKPASPKGQAFSTLSYDELGERLARITAALDTTAKDLQADSAETFQLPNFRALQGKRPSWEEVYDWYTRRVACESIRKSPG